jgi:diaminopropionate ammonia-lyase
MTVSEADAANAVATLAQRGMRSTPSGAAGMAGLLVALGMEETPGSLRLDHRSRVLIYLSEGPEDD